MLASSPKPYQGSPPGAAWRTTSVTVRPAPNGLPALRSWISLTTKRIAGAYQTVHALAAFVPSSRRALKVPAGTVTSSSAVTRHAVSMRLKRRLRWLSRSWRTAVQLLPTSRGHANIPLCGVAPERSFSRTTVANQLRLARSKNWTPTLSETRKPGRPWKAPGSSTV